MFIKLGLIKESFVKVSKISHSKRTICSGATLVKI